MSDRGFITEFQIQSFRDFAAAAKELLEELDECSIELPTLEILMTDLTQAWQELKAQFEEEEE